jgi:hypothetical protein
MHKHLFVGFVSALGIALGSTGALAGGWDDDCDDCGRAYSSYYYYAPRPAYAYAPPVYYAPPPVYYAPRVYSYYAPPVAYGYYAPRYGYNYGYRQRAYGGYRVHGRHW